jgi:hypothetical protein
MTETTHTAEWSAALASKASNADRGARRILGASAKRGVDFELMQTQAGWRWRALRPAAEGAAEAPAEVHPFAAANLASAAAFEASDNCRPTAAEEPAEVAAEVPAEEAPAEVAAEAPAEEPAEVVAEEAAEVPAEAPTDAGRQVAIAPGRFERLDTLLAESGRRLDRAAAVREEVRKAKPPSNEAEAVQDGGGDNSAEGADMASKAKTKAKGAKVKAKGKPVAAKAKVAPVKASRGGPGVKRTAAKQEAPKPKQRAASKARVVAGSIVHAKPAQSVRARALSDKMLKLQRMALDPNKGVTLADIINITGSPRPPMTQYLDRLAAHAGGRIEGRTDPKLRGKRWFIITA